MVRFTDLCQCDCRELFSCYALAAGDDRSLPSAQEMEIALRAGHLKGYGAFPDGRAAGFVAFMEAGDLLSINHLFVHRDYRAMGLGCALAEEVQRYFLARPWLHCLACLLYPDSAGTMPSDLGALGFSSFLRFWMECPLSRDFIEPPALKDLSILPLQEAFLPSVAEVLHRTNCRNVDNQLRPGIFDTPLSCFSFLEQIVAGFFGSFHYDLSFVAVHDRKIRGALFGTTRKGNEAFIPAVFVEPSFQGNGAGWRLLAAAMARFRDRGCQKVSLCVTAENEKACELYRRNGFITRNEYYEAIYSRPSTSPP